MSRQPEVVSSGLLRGWELPGHGGDKESNGRVLVVGGNVRMPGGVVLAAEAALRAGAGKLQIATVEPLAVPMGMAIPEAYVAGLAADDDGNLAPGTADEIVELAEGCAAVLLGPGIMSPDAAVALLERVVPRLDVSVVIDALGMAYLTEHADGVKHLDGRVILSPNAGELAQTLDEDEDAVSEDPLGAALRLSRRAGAVVVSGASTTYVTTPGTRATADLWAVQTGGQGMAVSVSGDVKAGMLVGLLGRGAEPAQAGVWGAYVHGRAGERLVAVHGRRGFLARELLAEIPRALAELDG
ncbi:MULTISPECIES: NAD(P)H-hydrate dehydratase [Arsenicicoccus]|uniref:NAD(P)H-hydrate dehydratase n=1 Tax=Arsenicicoccus TaxID=267408 RepID=UPI00257A3DD2|nr:MULTISPECIES: NAD(P)H-hydrate dehydratase [Arsenicicoccus]